jgi:hypothetical protein
MATWDSWEWISCRGGHITGHDKIVSDPLGYDLIMI